MATTSSSFTSTTQKISQQHFSGACHTSQSTISSHILNASGRSTKPLGNHEGSTTALPTYDRQSSRKTAAVLTRRRGHVLASHWWPHPGMPWPHLRPHSWVPTPHGRHTCTRMQHGGSFEGCDAGRPANNQGGVSTELPGKLACCSSTAARTCHHCS